MIYAIAAIDQKLGLATDAGIPWDLPADRQYVHQKINGAPILMGYQTYNERYQARPGKPSFVIVHPGTALRDGFRPVEDVDSFLAPYQNGPNDLWLVGGAHVYAKLLDRTQKLYLTRIDHDFNCTKFFPAFENQFELIEAGQPQTQNGLTFRYEVWQRKLSA